MDLNPTNIQQEASPSITANINQNVGETNSQVQQSYEAPAQAASRGLLGVQNNMNQGLSYGDQATTAAIKSRYNGQNVFAQNQLNIDTMKAADADHLRNLGAATQAASQEVELNRQKAILQWNIDQQNKKARGQILGTTLGIVGGVVGGVYGGAAGAGAGYAVGSGVGNAVGSAN